MSARVRGVIYFLFLAGFLISAPLVVLYTAGYRYSFGTGRVVQTGVLSITTFPKSASISIDGELMSGRTPLVLDNVLPGEHEVLVQKEGYVPWKKRLEVMSRDTTFVKDLVLFLQKEPTRIRGSEILASEHSSSSKKTAYAVQEDGWLELWMFESSSEDETLLARLPSRAGSAASVSWSASGSFVFATLQSANEQLVSLIDTRTLQSSSLSAIVPGATTGFWDTASDQIFYTKTPAGLWRIDTGTATAELLETPATLLTSDGTNLITAETVDDRVVVARAEGETSNIIAYIPLGSYAFHPAPQGFLLLEDLTRRHLLLLDARGGDRPILLNTEARIWSWEPSGRRLVYSNGFDLHIYDSDAHTDETLTRVSDEILGLAWYPNPRSVILYSQTQTLSAIELDRSGGRNVTALSIGDRFGDIWIDETGKYLYFFGTIGGEPGLYKRQLQR